MRERERAKGKTGRERGGKRKGGKIGFPYLAIYSPPPSPCVSLLTDVYLQG